MGERGDFGAHVVGTYTYRIICVVKKHACDEHELVIISSRARRRGLCCRSNRFPPTWSLTMRYTIITIIITLYIYIYVCLYLCTLSYYLLCPCTVHHHQCRSTGSVYINTTTILYIPIIGAWRRHANRLRARAPSKKA